MKMISYFSLFVHVLFFIVTIIATSNGKRLTYASAKANANFGNIIVNSVASIHIQLEQGHIQCLQSCLDNVRCMSFFYNFLSRECRHFEVDFTDPGEGVPEMGWKYYTVVRDCRINGLACPTSPGYTFLADICLCYKYVGVRYTNPQAKQYCANIKGYLIKIDRRLKQLEMERLLTTVPDPQQPNGDIHIQGTRIGSTSKWRYDDGQDMNYFQWNYGKGQPQLRYGENAILMQKIWGSMWHDTLASTQVMFVCEILL